MKVEYKEVFEITNSYIRYEQDLRHRLDKGTVRNDSKHNQTCLKNKLKRKKRK